MVAGGIQITGNDSRMSISRLRFGDSNKCLKEVVNILFGGWLWTWNYITFVAKRFASLYQWLGWPASRGVMENDHLQPFIEDVDLTT